MNLIHLETQAMNDTLRLCLAARRAIGCAALSGTLLMGAGPVPAIESAPAWNPVSSEKLIRLPGNFLEKAMDRSFAASPLGTELGRVNDRLHGQAATLRELRDAVRATDDPNVELQHQFLEAKSQYLDAMEVQQGLRRNALEKRLSVYRDAAERLRRDARAARDPVARELVDRQQAARARMEASARRVDETLALIARQDDGGYAEDYQRNLAEIERLKAAIDEHEMQRGPRVDGETVTREAYLRHLIVLAEAELGLLVQEETILGYMARLVALDARALETEITLNVADASGSGLSTTPRAADVTGLFVD